MPRNYTKGDQKLIDKARKEALHFVGFDGDGCQAPGAIVVRKSGSGHHPFVTHFFNSQDGGYYSGNYCTTEADAITAMDERLPRYDPDGTRRASFNQ